MPVVMISSSEQTLNRFYVETQSFGLSVKTTLNTGPCTPCGKPNSCTGVPDVAHSYPQHNFWEPPAQLISFSAHILLNAQASAWSRECLLNLEVWRFAIFNMPFALTFSFVTQQKRSYLYFPLYGCNEIQSDPPASSPLLRVQLQPDDEVMGFFSSLCLLFMALV